MKKYLLPLIAFPLMAFSFYGDIYKQITLTFTPTVTKTLPYCEYTNTPITSDILPKTTLEKITFSTPTPGNSPFPTSTGTPYTPTATQTATITPTNTLTPTSIPNHFYWVDNNDLITNVSVNGAGTATRSVTAPSCYGTDKKVINYWETDSRAYYSKPTYSWFNPFNSTTAKVWQPGYGAVQYVINYTKYTSSNPFGTCNNGDINCMMDWLNNNLPNSSAYAQIRIGQWGQSWGMAELNQMATTSTFLMSNNGDGSVNSIWYIRAHGLCWGAGFNPTSTPTPTLNNTPTSTPYCRNYNENDGSPAAEFNIDFIDQTCTNLFPGVNLSISALPSIFLDAIEFLDTSGTFDISNIPSLVVPSITVCTDNYQPNIKLLGQDLVTPLSVIISLLLVGAIINEFRS